MDNDPGDLIELFCWATIVGCVVAYFFVKFG